ncbi:DUF3329 domain-containing protein [Paenibacillus ihuae]|uniref:DUF3329 domain-containing protein n=1 Tax=Paenibacillus ihuae TaxID=1232431 RepID=UPI0006D56431|nr:DUF6056 family protein [Paenibacillus ihuae]
MKIEINVDDKTINIYRAIIIFLSIVIFGYFLKLNGFTPYWNDEFYYSFISGGDAKLGSIYDIIRSQHYLYFNWTGRILIHGIVQIFLLVGKDYFNIFNSIFILFLIYLVCSFVRVRKFNNKEDLRDFIIVTLLLWFLMPVMGQTTFWLAGSINYLWSTVFVLVFLLPYRYLLEDKYIIRNNIASVVVMFFLGLLAGWSQENAAVTAVVFVGSAFIFIIYKHKKIPYWFISGSMGLIIGAIFLLLAPGNGVRKEKMYFDLSLRDQIHGFIQSMKYIVLHEQLSLFILFLVMFIYVLFTKAESKTKNISLTLLLFLSGFTSYLAMIASPEFPTRATFIGAIFIVISIMVLSSCINQKFLVAIMIVAIIPFFLSVTNLYNDMQTVGHENALREKVVAESIETGNYDVRLPKYSVEGSDRVFIFDITMNPKYTSNEHFAKFYGLDSVVIDTPVLVVELKEPVINQYQLYYDTGKGYNESDTSYAGIYNQTDGKRLYFKLPNKPIYRFRFDPGIHANEKIEISKITIQNKNIIKNYDSAQLQEMLIPQHDIYSVTNKVDYLELITSGSDPQLEFVNDYTDKGTGITIDFAGELSEEIQIFYDLGKGFNENNSVKVDMNDDNKLVTKLPAKNIHNLRIDLGNKQDVVIGIKTISIEAGKTIEIKDLFGKTSSLIQLEKSEVKDDIDYFTTKGNDPSFQINDLESILASE